MSELGDDLNQAIHRANPALRPKVKECCGYPVATQQGFRLSFYWLAYESEYASEKYDTDIYDRTHNQYLEVLATGGLVGIAAFISIWIAIGVTLTRAYRGGSASWHVASGDRL